MWHQGSRVMWLAEGDRNSRYFHQKASSQWHKYNIFKLQNDNGEWMEGNQLDSFIIDYFQSIFSSDGQSGQMRFLEPLRGQFTIQMNEILS